MTQYLVISKVSIPVRGKKKSSKHCKNKNNKNRPYVHSKPLL